MQNRIGKFYVSRHMVEHAPDYVMVVMGKVIVVRAELQWHKNQFEYTALSPAFDEVIEGEMVPEYSVGIDTRTAPPSVTFERTEA